MHNHKKAIFQTINIRTIIKHKLGVMIENGETAKQLVYNERYARFNQLVNSKFDKERLLTLIVRLLKSNSI